MKFKIGDKVKVIASIEKLKENGISRVKRLANTHGTIRYIGNGDKIPPCPIEVYFPHIDNCWWFEENDLELIKVEQEQQPTIRKFETGATRDTVEGKLSYVKALSPIVLQRYVQYLNAHRKQPDGSMREFDNWKNGIPIDAYFDGLGRHFIAIWLLEQGFVAEDNHGPVTLEDSLCAVIFNAMGWLHELLKDEGKRIYPVSVLRGSRLCADCHKMVENADNGTIIAVCEKCRVLLESIE